MTILDYARSLGIDPHDSDPTPLARRIRHAERALEPPRRWTAVDTLLVLFVLVTFGLGCALLGQVVQDEWRERHPAKPPVEQVTPSTPGAPAYGA